MVSIQKTSYCFFCNGNKAIYYCEDCNLSFCEGCGHSNKFTVYVCGHCQSNNIQCRQRTSVNMPIIEDVEGTGLSQVNLRQILRHERRVEFPIEGLRYADMLRWKDESLVHDVMGYDKSKLSDPSSPATWEFEQINIATRSFDSEKGWLWPIPQTELQNNENLDQNPGY